MTAPPATDGNNEELGDEYEVETVDVPIHTPAHPFCWDMTCPCHEDGDLIQEVNQVVQEGELTTKEADHIYHGRTV